MMVSATLWEVILASIRGEIKLWKDGFSCPRTIAQLEIELTRAF